MKKIILISATLLMIALISCKKENIANRVQQLTGTQWTGNYAYHTGIENKFYEFQFISSDSIVVSSSDAASPYVARGLWTISGDSVKATFTYLSLGQTFKMATKYPGSSSQLSGIWMDPLDAADWGTFTLLKN